MSATKPSVLVIGGTGAQGAAVVQELAKSNTYTIYILTRTTSSTIALELASLPDVFLVEGSAHDEPTLHSVLTGIDIVFANTNGFAIGEKAEIYWGIRLFELSSEHKIKHFIWGGLESSYQLSGYQPRFRTGHFDGKQKVTNWMSTQPSGGGSMMWSVLTSCMYIEMLGELLAPWPEKDPVTGEEVVVFQAPVGKGAPPMIYLPDLGRYARWIIETPSKSSGLNLKIATAHTSYPDIAAAFTEVTGRKAIFRDLTLDEYFSSGLFPTADAKVGHSVDHSDGTLQSYRQNFSGFWNTWKEDIILRDLGNLDEILPGRLRSVGEWMKMTGYTGERKSVLKDYRDAGAMPAPEQK